MTGAGFSDPEFLRRLKERDRTAVADIVEAYLPQLLRAGLAMGFTRDENEDLAQSAFTTLLETLGRFEGRSHIRTYLFGIFYHKVSEYYRERRRTEQSDPIDEVMESRFDVRGNWRQPPADIEKQIFEREARALLQECLEALPRTQRVAFYLREVEEIETSEICKKMEISATNLGVLLYRARNRLRECMERKGLKAMCVKLQRG